MSLLVDASALVAIARGEAEADSLLATLGRHSVRLTNGIAVWEAARALARDHPDDLPGGLIEVERYCHQLAISVVPIGTLEAVAAIEAQHRYGKGTGHPAQLNMGDCFAYASAKTNNARLLYKGDDFSRTDLA